MSRFGQPGVQVEVERRFQLSQRLENIEDNRESVPAINVLRGAKALLADLQAGPRWNDSQHGITASFKNLWQDAEVNKPYLAYTDITARVRSLIAWAAARVTSIQAQQEGVATLHRLSTAEGTEAGLRTGIRLDRPGGLLFETARETPEPFTEEAVRRGGQVKRVGQQVLTELEPIAQQQKRELEKRNIVNTGLVVTSLGMLILMKNKILAVLGIGALVYFFKKEAIQEVKGDIESVTSKLT